MRIEFEIYNFTSLTVISPPTCPFYDFIKVREENSISFIMLNDWFGEKTDAYII